MGLFNRTLIRAAQIDITTKSVFEKLADALDVLYGSVTPGTAAASSALVTDASNNLAGLNNLTLNGVLTSSSTDTITAHAGGGQALATALTTTFNRVTTVTTAGDSVVLPAAARGLTVVVYNDGANPLAVFPAGTDSINDLAASAAMTQLVNSVFTFACSSAGLWQCESVGSGFSGNLPTVSSTNGITAFATGGQAGAVLLTTVINRITTVGTAGDSVKLPVAVPGLMMVVTNAAAVNSMNLFPNTGDQINAGGANAAYAIVAGKTASLSCAVAGQWHAVLSA